MQFKAVTATFTAARAFDERLYVVRSIAINKMKTVSMFFYPVNLNCHKHNLTGGNLLLVCFERLILKHRANSTCYSKYGVKKLFPFK